MSTNRQIQRCPQYQYQHQQMRTYRQSCRRAWSQIQGGLIGTKQNLKTGKEEYDYTSRVTELWRLTTGS